MVVLTLRAADFRQSDGSPAEFVTEGSTADGVTVEGLAFIISTGTGAPEEMIADFHIDEYGGGNISLYVHWHSDTGTANDIEWTIDQYAATPGDTTDLRTRTFSNIGVIEDTASGAGRPERTAVLTWSSSLPTDGDQVFLRVSRTAPAGTEMTGDAILRYVQIEYS